MRFQSLLYAMIIAATVQGCGASTRQTTQSAPMLLGPAFRYQFFQPDYRKFADAYDTTSVDQAMASLVGATFADVRIVVLFGTWCPDSRRELPRLWRLMDAAGIDSSRVTYIGLDRAKRDPEGAAAQYAVQLVPTIVFLKGEAEIGRIEESPKTTFEGDVLSILATQSR